MSINNMQRTALCAAADAERWAEQDERRPMMSVKTATLVALLGCATTILLRLLFYMDPYRGFHWSGFRILMSPLAILAFLMQNLALITLAVFLFTLFRKQ